jgi:alkylation response protein AidB-like acyl-CoA dehydrogenase
MDFSLSEEQVMLQNTVKRFAQKEVKPYFQKLDMAPLPAPKVLTQQVIRERYPWDLWNKMHEMGLCTLAIPQELGGGGVSLLTQAIVGEELGKAGGLNVILQTTHEHLLDEWGTDEQKEEFLTRCVKDPASLIANCIAEPEPETKSDNTHPDDEPGITMKTFAYRDGDEYVLNGFKRHVNLAPLAKLFIIWCRTDKNKPISKSTSGFLVPEGTPGLSLGDVFETQVMMGRGGVNAEVVIENVRIPARYRLGPEGEMWFRRKKQFSYRDILIMAGKAGSIHAVFEETLEYAKTKILEGKPLIEHVNIGLRLADMLATVETAKLYYRKLASDWDNQKTGGIWNENNLFLFRGFLADMTTKFFLDGLEVWGGVGVQKETSFNRHFTGHLSGGHGIGSSDQMRLRVMKWLASEPTGIL